MTITYTNGLSAAKLYSAIFGEPASASVVASYENGKSSSTTVAQAMWADAAQGTGYASYNYDNNTVLVYEIYMNVLGRTEAEIAADTGVVWWVGQLDAGNYSADEAVVAILGGINPANDPYGDQAYVDANLILGDEYFLTNGADDLEGTANNDTFTADIFDNSNSFESGDRIDGGSGTDTLFADIGNSHNFAITARTDSVENFTVRAQADATESADNNTEGAVQVDAERMDGTTKYTSEESRADVIIEDVRIDSDEITSDITIAMVSTDAGNVDMGVYFDQDSLTAAQAVSSGSTLNLELMDTKNAIDDNFLTDNPYNAVTFSLGDTVITLDFGVVTTTYADLLTAIQTAIAADSTLANVTAALTGDFTARDTDTGTISTGSTITLTNAGDEALAVGTWIASAGVPGTSSLHTSQDTAAPASEGNLITSEIILDHVGSSSMGGDLIVGGMSTGDTSDSTGVEQFNITVERSSELQNIASTDNTLEEVYIVNGTIEGNLVVAGELSNGQDSLPGAVTADTAGFTDVRVMDASEMVGTVSIDAELTSDVVAKYMNRVDEDGVAADDISFLYDLGTSNDTLTLEISNSNLAAAGTTSREDFELTVSGNAGNDTITTIIGDGTGTNASIWYRNSVDNANLTVDGDNGDDTITTTGAGNMTINAGSGDDTVYTDNSGIQTLGAGAQIDTVTKTIAVGNTAATTAFVEVGDVVTYTINGTSGTYTVVAADHDNVIDGTSIHQDFFDNIVAAINADGNVNTVVTAAVTDADNFTITSDVAGVELNTSISITTDTSDDGVIAMSTATTTANAAGGATTAKATYVVNAANAVISDLDSSVLGGFVGGASTNTTSGSMFNYNGTSTVTVTIAGSSSAGAGQVSGAAAATTVGFESTAITIDATDSLSTQADINQAIKEAINSDAVLSKLMVAQDGPANTLVLTSLIDGVYDANDIDINIAAATLESTDVDGFNADWIEAVSDSTDTVVLAAAQTIADNYAAEAATMYDTEVLATDASAVAYVGAVSLSVSDNTINLGTGDDVLVLGTDATSNDTIVFTGSSIGDNTIVNFDDQAASGYQDTLDFTAYLTDTEDSVSTSDASVARVVTTSEVDAADSMILISNEVLIVNNFVQESATLETWADLTASDLVDALDGTEAYGDAGQVTELGAATTTPDANLVGTTMKTIIMIENDLNDGEYKVFDVTTSDVDLAGEAFSATLIGTIDVGSSLADTMLVS